jgi:hypothetical protein
MTKTQAMMRYEARRPLANAINSYAQAEVSREDEYGHSRGWWWFRCKRQKRNERGVSDLTCSIRTPLSGVGFARN